jgi:uncharacterized phage-associated protein
MKTYSAKAIANAFLEQAMKEDKVITPMKLQKLVYLAHGWYLGYTGQPLVSDQVEAWQYGPVINSLYHQFKKFGSTNITEKSKSWIMNKDTLQVEEITPVIDLNDTEAAKFIIGVWDTYKDFDATELSSMTHKENTPWHKTFHSLPTNIIHNNLILEHYKELIGERVA